MFAWLGECDGNTFAAGSADASDAVHIRLGCRRNVVVHDVREVLDVETTRCHVGGDEQISSTGSHSTHHPIALLLIHAAVQGFGAIATTVEGFGELVDFASGTTEHDCGLGRFDVKDSAECRGLVVPRHHVGALFDQRRSTGVGTGLLDGDAQRVSLVLLGDRFDAGWERGREENRLT